MSFSHVEVLRVGLRDARGERPVGRLAWVERRVLFEFDATFLADPLPLSPVRLPVAPGVHVEPKHTFDGLFGLFDDSLPDGWGRLLLDREMDRLGVGRGALTPLDRLAYVGEDGPGALVYRPALERGRPPSVVDLRTLADESARVLEGDAPEVFPELLALGGSSGGARPKVQVCLRPADGRLAVGTQPDGFVPILVKFRSRADPPDAGALEEAWARVARSAGIEVSESWLLGDGFFATRRFDRLPRVHLHSLGGLLHADHRVPSLDYEALLKTTRFLTRDERAVAETWRRAVFNVLAHNRDDHPRNFAFLMDAAGRWRPSPAFDLTFSAGPGGEHWMTVAGEGRRPGREHLLTVARRAGVRDRDARRILDEVGAAVSGWERVAADVGVSLTTRRRIAGVLGG